ncbi:MAG: hypothetical protein H0T73_07340 [Ardenticatenales bacterium]|nr:hypothetical protein [Ardenticatenales bacterium]
MEIERPELSTLPAEIRAYIEALEAELEQLRAGESRGKSSVSPLEADEPPTTINIVTISAKGTAKRTPRHLYQRQRRGGMGVFDLEMPEEEAPAFLVAADESESLLLISNFARVFLLPLRELPESLVRSKGIFLLEHLPFDRGEKLLLALPHQRSGYLAVVTRSGQVRRLHHTAVREGMAPGTLLYTVTELGLPAAACWTPGDADLFIATRQGRAIRFAEREVPAKSGLGIRLGEGEAIAAVTAVRPESGVFLLGADGRGTIRLMSGFSANKAPGAGGKSAISAEEVVGAVTVGERDDIFIISRLGKLIRFRADEVPPKEGVVQGVHCMALRADECAAVTTSERVRDNKETPATWAERGTQEAEVSTKDLDGD